MHRSSVIALVLALVRGATAASAPLAVPLRLGETGDVARHQAPASVSVPFARGALRDPQPLWLAAPDGRPAPLQTQALERWPDGSIRWLLVDFLADVPAGGHATYTLRDRDRPRGGEGPRLQTSVRDGAHVVDAGPLRVTVDGTHVTLALPGGKRVAVTFPALAIEGDAVPPAGGTITVETQGPVRTELRVDGRYPGDVTSETRVAVFAGQPVVRVRHTVTSLSDRPVLAIRSLALAVPGRFDEAALGIDGDARRLRLERAHELRQIDAADARLDEAGAHHGDGWAEATGDGVRVTVVVRDFWEEYPKTFRVEHERLVLDLLAGVPAPVRLGTGAAKTHEVWLALEPAATKTAAADLARAVTEPLVALPPPLWTVATRALPQALAPDSPAARDFLARLTTAYAHYAEHVRTERWDDGAIDACDSRTPPHVRVGLYGVLNWGDWQFPGLRSRTHGCESWGNLEYDLPQVLALAWSATGDRELWDAFLAAGRHYRDVDIIHHAPAHPEWVGMNHPHKWRHFSFETAEKVDLGHTWAEGLVTLYRLTGETRALAAARALGDALAARTTRTGNPRQFGWPMIALTAVWDATGDVRYRDAAHDFARRALDAHAATPAAGDWKMGILADGMAATYAATGDERLRRWLTDYADALVAEPARYPDPRYALPLGYLAALTGDPRYAARAVAAAASLKLGGWGKPLAAMGRTGFRLLAPLAEADVAPPTSLRKPGATGVTPGRAAPRPGSPPARRAPSPSRAAPARPVAD